MLAEYQYTYDEAGDLVSETDNGVTTNYQYDQTGQLVGYGNKTQTYDPNGNRANPGYVVGAGNQLLSDGTWSYAYDKEGNLVSKVSIKTGEKWTYGYDNINELISAVLTTAKGQIETASYCKYDVFGNRIESDVFTRGKGTVVTRFVYDAWNPNVPSGVGNENWSVWATLNVHNQLTTRYIHGDALDQVFAQMSSHGQVGWYLTDHLGSTRLLVSNSGAVLDKINYDAFGNITSQSSVGNEPLFLYTGQQWDSATGLLYGRARYYDPVTGRWISQDPTGLNGGDSNLYRYVTNRSTMATDPSGLLEWLQTPQASGRISLSVVREFLAFNLGPTERWVGYLDPNTGIVQRGTRYALLEEIQAAGYQADWDAWFQENDVVARMEREQRPFGANLGNPHVNTREPEGTTTVRSLWYAADPEYRQQLAGAAPAVVGLVVHVLRELGVSAAGRLAAPVAARMASAGFRVISRGTRKILFRRVGQRVIFYAEHEAVEIVRSYRGRQRGWSQSAPSSDALSRNLGIQGTGRHAHHIVPGDINGAAADRARALLNRYQIDINSAVNGVSLTENHHMRTGLHRLQNVELVANTLTDAVAGIRDWTQARLALIDALSKLKAEIASRGFPPR